MPHAHVHSWFASVPCCALRELPSCTDTPTHANVHTRCHLYHGHATITPWAVTFGLQCVDQSSCRRLVSPGFGLASPPWM
eukprot:6427992-Alexandrium_andersonii.AAC.1